MGIKYKQGRRLALVLALLLAVNALLPAMANAGALTNTYVRLNRMKAATDSTFRLVFTTSAAALTEDSITINFNTAWTSASGTVNTTTQAVSSASCATETGATALPGSLTAGASGTTVTISGVTNLSATTAYCVDLTTTNAVHNPSAGEYYVNIATRTSAPADIDTARVAVRIVADDTITVTASVPPTFNFALDANTTAFTAELTPGTKRTTTARTITVNTNAKTGWVAWLRNSDSNGLYSAGVNANIAPTTPGTAVDVDSAPSTEQYVWGVTATSQVAGLGTTTVPAAYDASGTNEGSGVDNSFRTVASSSGTSQDAVVTLVSAATISPITPASSDYTDIIQVIGAGNF
jgi:hypothetical protein